LNPDRCTRGLGVALDVLLRTIHQTNAPAAAATGRMNPMLHIDTPSTWAATTLIVVFLFKVPGG
jgi:hypothetical protein